MAVSFIERGHWIEPQTCILITDKLYHIILLYLVYIATGQNLTTLIRHICFCDYCTGSEYHFEQIGTIKSMSSLPHCGLVLP